MARASFISYDNPVQMELAMMALVASPDAQAACDFLKAEHNIIAVPSKLTAIARSKPKQYEDLREKVAPVKEKILTHNLMDNALYASEVTKVSMEQLMERLAEGRVPTQFLSRVARDIADVQTKSVDKKLALESRPTVIIENRSPAQIIRALEQKGIMRPMIEAGND